MTALSEKTLPANSKRPDRQQNISLLIFMISLSCFKNMALPQNLWVKSYKNWGFPPQTPRILEA